MRANDRTKQLAAEMLLSVMLTFEVMSTMSSIKKQKDDHQKLPKRWRCHLLRVPAKELGKNFTSFMTIVRQVLYDMCVCVCAKPVKSDSGINPVQILSMGRACLAQSNKKIRKKARKKQ